MTTTTSAALAPAELAAIAGLVDQRAVDEVLHRLIRCVQGADLSEAEDVLAPSVSLDPYGDDVSAWVEAFGGDGATVSVMLGRELSFQATGEDAREVVLPYQVSRVVDSPSPATRLWGGTWSLRLTRGGPVGWQLASLSQTRDWELGDAQPVAGVGVSAHDWIQIQTLYARYAASVDSGDVEAFAALFAPDAVFHVPDGVTTVTNLRAMAAGMAADRAARDSQSRHWTHHLVFTPAGEGTDGGEAKDDRLVVRGFAGVDGSVGGQYVTLASGRTTDELVRDQNGQWLFASRRPEPDLPLF
ncbi:nuclear transport factor 2 family protein [Streptomyces sp. YKOK-I1]